VHRCAPCVACQPCCAVCCFQLFPPFVFLSMHSPADGTPGGQASSMQGRDCYLFNLDDQHVLDSTEAGALCRFTVGRGLLR